MLEYAKLEYTCNGLKYHDFREDIRPPQIYRRGLMRLPSFDHAFDAYGSTIDEHTYSYR